MSKPQMYCEIVKNKYNVKLNFLTGSFLCEDNIDAKEGEPKNKYTLTVTQQNSDGTHMAQICNLDQYLELLCNDNLDDDSFKQLIELCSFFPVRSKAQNYQKYCMGLYPIQKRNEIVESKYRDKVFNLYTYHDSRFYQRVNIFLALDSRFDKFHNENEVYYGEYIKQLKCCIGWQNPKHKGIVYRGAKLTPFELYSYKFKDIFYIPSFVSTSIDKNISLKEFKGNVLIEIDITKENRFSTIIQKQQTNYPEEKECLISCYNIYKFKEISFNKNDDYVILKLETVNYDDNNDIKNNNIYKAVHGNLPEKFRKSGSSKINGRNLSGYELFDIYNQLVDAINTQKK